MGVTVHFEGQVKDEGNYQKLISEAVAFAKDCGMQYSEIYDNNKTLSRVKNEEDWDYTGLVKGVKIILLTRILTMNSNSSLVLPNSLAEQQRAMMLQRKFKSISLMMPWGCSLKDVATTIRHCLNALLILAAVLGG